MALFLAYKHCNNLHTLNIIGDKGVIALSDCLKHCNKLHALDIRNNNFGTEGAIYLSIVITSIYTLDIRNNNIQGKGAFVLRDGLKCCNNLRTLNVRKIDIVQLLSEMVFGTVSLIFIYSIS